MARCLFFCQLRLLCRPAGRLLGLLFGLLLSKLLGLECLCLALGLLLRRASGLCLEFYLLLCLLPSLCLALGPLLCRLPRLRLSLCLLLCRLPRLRLALCLLLSCQLRLFSSSNAPGLVLFPLGLLLRRPAQLVSLAPREAVGLCSCHFGGLCCVVGLESRHGWRCAWLRLQGIRKPAESIGDSLCRKDGIRCCLRCGWHRDWRRVSKPA